jgi:hypothetical protein
MFCATVKTATSRKCWWTIPTPLTIAVRGAYPVTSSPPISTEPASGLTVPERIPIRVLLPAPFSPTSTWISPPRTDSEIPSFARSVPYVFETDRSSTLTGPAVGAPAAAALLFVHITRLPVRALPGGPAGRPRAARAARETGQEAATLTLPEIRSLVSWVISACSAAGTSPARLW